MFKQYWGGGGGEPHFIVNFEKIYKEINLFKKKNHKKAYHNLVQVVTTMYIEFYCINSTMLSTIIHKILFFIINNESRICSKSNPINQVIK